MDNKSESISVQKAFTIWHWAPSAPCYDRIGSDRIHSDSLDGQVEEKKFPHIKKQNPSVASLMYCEIDMVPKLEPSICNEQRRLLLLWGVLFLFLFLFLLWHGRSRHPISVGSFPR